MEEFKWLLTAEAAKAIDQLSKRERVQLFLIFDHIARFPHVSGMEVGGQGRKRPAFHNVFGRWTITWWVDFPVKEIHILDIEKR